MPLLYPFRSRQARNAAIVSVIMCTDNDENGEENSTDTENDAGVPPATSADDDVDEDDTSTILLEV